MEGLLFGETAASPRWGGGGRGPFCVGAAPSYGHPVWGLRPWHSSAGAAFGASPSPLLFLIPAILCPCTCAHAGGAAGMGAGGHQRRVVAVGGLVLCVLGAGH